jgi:hypothetical protein
LVVADGALVDAHSQIHEIPTDARLACGQAAAIKAVAFLLVTFHAIVVWLVRLGDTLSHALSFVKQKWGYAHLAEPEGVLVKARGWLAAGSQWVGDVACWARRNARCFEEEETSFAGRAVVAVAGCAVSRTWSACEIGGFVIAGGAVEDAGVIGARNSCKSCRDQSALNQVIRVDAFPAHIERTNNLTNLTVHQRAIGIGPALSNHIKCPSTDTSRANIPAVTRNTPSETLDAFHLDSVDKRSVKRYHLCSLLHQYHVLNQRTVTIVSAAHRTEH